MQQIADWLEKLGMSEYAERFAENDIDMAVLPDLTDQHLKDLGVSLGHRLKMLRAIRDLSGASSAATTPSAPMATEPTRRDEAERRQLTIMFCDLVGSTALSTRLDPEDLRDIIAAYHRAVAEMIGQFGGFVAKYMGDGVLAYFGYPQAHEDDAERAVSAALALVAAIGRLETGERLQLRIGIATGLVVVGDLIGTGEAQERGVVGETPNLAARMQQLAPPNGVVVAEGTRRLLGELFELRDLGVVVVKGFAAAGPVWQVLRPNAVESHFEALRAASLTPLVGREEELDLLVRLWHRAASGEGQAVLISGEPGIGKSRLTAAFRDRLAGEAYTRPRYFCSPHHQDSALYPFISQLERAAGFEREDPVEKKFEKLEAVLAPAAPPPEDMGLLAELLSLPARFSLPPWTPQRRREKTFKALLCQLEALARQKPVLMVFEDLHWIDPSSRELLDRMIERITSLPVLLLVTFRPEFAPPWIGLSQVTALTLSRLDRHRGLAMVENIAGDTGFSSEIAAEVVERADGVPLFVEELTKAVLEASGSGAEVEKALAGAVSPSAAVPATLHASLMSRLDRLGQATKEIAQMAAAIGREFSYELLAPIAERRDAEFQDALGRLTDAGLVFHRSAPPHATYLFKHALVRDAAYGSLLRRRREELHARIASVLERDFADRVAAEPELLARHLTDAGLFEKAIPWWVRAGERATERSANREAIAHFKRGIDILGRFPESRERDEQELPLQAALIVPSMAIAAGPGGPARRAVELGARIGVDSPAQFHAIFARGWLTDVLTVTGELRSALPFAAETLSIAERLGDPLLLSRTHVSIGQVHLHLGDVGEARRHLEESLALYDPERDRAKAARFGYDTYTFCQALLGVILWDQGFPDEALRHAEEAIVGGRAAAHPFSEAVALSFRAMIHQSRGEATLCLDRANAALALATELGLRLHAGSAMALVGWALVRTAATEEGLARLRSGVDAIRALSARGWWSLLFPLLPGACFDVGRIEEGLSAVHEELVEVEETEARHYEAELNRLEGELLLASKEPDESRAEASLRKAIEIALAQQAKSPELRAATSLARLWREQGKRDEARELLAPVYGWFTEGFDTLDLKQAKALLDELAA
jgi:class 3 adenylate cyclase/predicted ATPase